jgi:hypothetical protein
MDAASMQWYGEVKAGGWVQFFYDIIKHSSHILKMFALLII